MPPIISAPHTKSSAEAIKELLTGAAASLPASMIAGAANAVFIKAYKTAHPPSAADIGRYVPNFPLNKTKRSSKGTSKAFIRLIPLIPRCKKNMTMQSPAIEQIGTLNKKSASSPASIPAHGTKQTDSKSVARTALRCGAIA